MLGRIRYSGWASILIVICMMAFAFPFSAEGTGDLGNEPPGGYSEDSEIFIITSGTTATTSFSSGETINVGISTAIVDLNGNEESANELYITDIYGNDVSTHVKFTQGIMPMAFSYTASITAPITPDHYLLRARIMDDNQNQFVAKDVIMVQGNMPEQKYIKTYSDAAYTTVDWTFTSEDIIYIEVYSGELPSKTQSSVMFSDYNGGESTKSISELTQNTVTMIGNYSRIQYDISNDLDATDLTDGKLNENYWYGLTIDLRRANGGVITSDWTIQIQITDVVVVVPSLSVQPDATQVSPNTVEREGTESTRISTQFEDTDESPAGSFIITFKVKHRQSGEEITLVNRKTHGQSGEFGGTVSVTDSGGGLYRASYDLDPDNTFSTGDYDLYFKVEDGTGESAEDGFNNNQNELHITSSTSPPGVSWSATQCDPNTVDKIGEYVTEISTQFTDSDSVSVNDFTVLFKVRDPDNNEIILVDNKTDGGAGEYEGNLEITSSGQGVFTASYTFDPDGSFQAGRYDLFFKVTDQHGNSATDGFNRNQNELEITSSAAEPTVHHGATQVIPDIVNKTGDGVTTISVEFRDMDSDSVTNFTVTFKVKDENGTEYVLVNSAKNGEAGEFDGTLAITSSSPNVYVASYVWDPPSSIPNGEYSLYFRVEDEWANYAEDGYANNNNELTITGIDGGPDDDGKEDDEATNYLWILLLIILIFILLIILLAAKRRKGEKTSPYPPTESPEGETPSPTTPTSEQDTSPSSTSSQSPPQIPPSSTEKS